MITVKTTINASLEKVWDFWTKPEHVINWNFASDDWHCPKAENNLKIGEKFCYTMAAKNGEMSFDFEGEYTEIETHKLIKYKLEDDRRIIIQFEQNQDLVTIIESFDPENENSLELQQNGWQAILDNFKKYIESN
jgi:uncharacterized protein YndB with AHSA1/START domain